MRFGLDLRGGPELARTLNALSASVRRRKLYEILRIAGEPLRAAMAAQAPRRAPAPDLADNIAMSPALKIPDAAGDADRVDDFQAAIAIGPTKGFFYGLFLEYGTVRMGAQSFMRPPFDRGVPKMLSTIRDEYWDAFRPHVMTGSAPTAVVGGPGGGGLI